MKQTSTNPNEAERRHTTISFRVTHAERSLIDKLAEKCGMRISDYIRCRAINYEPKARLTPAQETLRDELLKARSDYMKYNSMLRSMSQQERVAMFRNQRWMIDALKELGAAARLISAILKKHFGPNITPKITRNQVETTNKE